MAHQLDFSKGSAAFVSKKVPAWHNLGTILPRNLTAQDLLTYGGLDFEVAKLPNTHILSTRKQNQMKDVLDYAFGGVGQKEAVEGTAWWAYNAVTGYVSNVQKYATEEARFDSLLMSAGAKTIDRALTLAMTPTLIEPLRGSSIQGINLN